MQLRKVFNNKKCSHIVIKTSRAGIECSTINRIQDFYKQHNMLGALGVPRSSEVRAVDY